MPQNDLLDLILNSPSLFQPEPGAAQGAPGTDMATILEHIEALQHRSGQGMVDNPLGPVSPFPHSPISLIGSVQGPGLPPVADFVDPYNKSSLRDQILRTAQDQPLGPIGNTAYPSQSQISNSLLPPDPGRPVQGPEMPPASSIRSLFSNDAAPAPPPPLTEEDVRAANERPGIAYGEPAGPAVPAGYRDIPGPEQQTAVDEEFPGPQIPDRLQERNMQQLDRERQNRFIDPNKYSGMSAADGIRMREKEILHGERVDREVEDLLSGVMRRQKLFPRRGQKGNRGNIALGQRAMQGPGMGLGLQAAGLTEEEIAQARGVQEDRVGSALGVLGKQAKDYPGDGINGPIIMTERASDAEDYAPGDPRRGGYASLPPEVRQAVRDIGANGGSGGRMPAFGSFMTPDQRRTARQKTKGIQAAGLERSRGRRAEGRARMNLHRGIGGGLANQLANGDVGGDGPITFAQRVARNGRMGMSEDAAIQGAALEMQAEQAASDAENKPNPMIPIWVKMLDNPDLTDEQRIQVIQGIKGMMNPNPESVLPQAGGGLADILNKPKQPNPSSMDNFASFSDELPEAANQLAPDGNWPDDPTEAAANVERVVSAQPNMNMDQLRIVVRELIGRNNLRHDDTPTLEDYINGSPFFHQLFYGTDEDIDSAGNQKKGQEEINRGISNRRKEDRLNRNPVISEYRRRAVNDGVPPWMH